MCEILCWFRYLDEKIFQILTLIMLPIWKNIKDDAYDECLDDDYDYEHCIH